MEGRRGEDAVERHQEGHRHLARGHLSSVKLFQAPVQSDMPCDSGDLARLKDILVRRSLSTAGEFTLHSGEKSTVYVDGKLTTMVAEAMPLVGRAFLGRMRERGWSPQAVGGLTLGADPIAFAIARESIEAGSPIDAFVARKEPKKHGTQKFIEGLDSTEGKRVVILDDVCTRGDSTWQAISKAQDAGMHVLGAICLVDRQQGATEMLAGKGVALAHVFTLAELVAHKDGLGVSAGVK
jgi:orotate phosphoribosyltransferase